MRSPACSTAYLMLTAFSTHVNIPVQLYQAVEGPACTKAPLAAYGFVNLGSKGETGPTAWSAFHLPFMTVPDHDV